METDYKKELIERLNKVGVEENGLLKVIDEMLLEHQDIWEISYEVCYDRTDGKAPEGYCTACAYIKNLSVITGRTKCMHCEDYFLKTREWSKFCSDKCRQAAFRAHNKALFERLKKESDEQPVPSFVSKGPFIEDGEIVQWKKVKLTPEGEESFKEYVINSMNEDEHAKMAFFIKVGEPIILPPLDPKDVPEGLRKLITPEELVLFPEN